MRLAHMTLAVTAALAIAAPVLAQGGAAGGRAGAGGGAGRAGGGGGGPAMTLTTNAFPDGGTIPVRFTQAGEGVATGEGTSPALNWANAPTGTQSFLLHMHDMEVVRMRTLEDQAHWVVWNIPATATGLPEGVPRGATLSNGAFQISATGPVYRGPGAPANGPPHHYVFELYALDTTLNVQPSEDAFDTRRRVLEAANGHILGKAVYLGLFKRPN
jgi:Raf kinase inhibitor-like YbhB/YbcL family protein